MKSATFNEVEEVDELEQLGIKGWIQLPKNRESFSVSMILILLNRPVGKQGKINELVKA